MSENKKINLDIYTSEEIDVISSHIDKYYGSFDTVFHEKKSPDLHIDICIIEPSEEKPYYQLVTMGMGAYSMNIPKELAEYKLERAELVIALPPEWKIYEKDEKWYWPIRLLKEIARMAKRNDTWLAWGHTIDREESFDKSTELCGSMLVTPVNVKDEAYVCQIPNGDNVNFYQVIPLYREEIQYKIENGLDALFEKMSDTDFIIDPNRTNVTVDDDMFMDIVNWRIDTLYKKKLPVDEINVFNHMAIYLRWCLEHNLMNDYFLKRNEAYVEKFKADPLNTDLRPFIRDNLESLLLKSYFNEEGQAFAEYYYADSLVTPSFPADIDNYAFEYFGEKRYHSKEFDDEAYLFIPFNEDYYQAMANIIQKRWDIWQNQDVSYNDYKGKKDLVNALTEYIGDEYISPYFPSLKNDDPITAVYSYERRIGIREGYIPMLVVPDENLWEQFLFNTDAETNDENEYSFDKEKVEIYRKNVLSHEVKDGKTVLSELAEKYGTDKIAENILNKVKNFSENNVFLSYWNYGSQMTYPLVLLRIPVKNPWEVFAYLPFGAWNDCPDTDVLMAVSKHWYEKYGAVPAVMTGDTLEYILPNPVPQESVEELTKEQYAFCCDLEQNEPINLSASKKWYFWWD